MFEIFPNKFGSVLRKGDLQIMFLLPLTLWSFPRKEEEEEEEEEEPFEGDLKDKRIFSILEKVFEHICSITESSNRIIFSFTRILIMDRGVAAYLLKRLLLYLRESSIR